MLIEKLPKLMLLPPVLPIWFDVMIGMSKSGRSSRTPTARVVGTPSDAMLIGFARLLLLREKARPQLALVSPPAKKATLPGS